MLRGNVPLRVFSPDFSSSLITTGGLQSAAAAVCPLGGRMGNERGGEDVRKRRSDVSLRLTVLTLIYLLRLSSYRLTSVQLILENI